MLDAGDSLLNDRDPARKTRGRSSIELMNHMGYDAMALGLNDLNTLSLEELRQRMAEANFAILSANAYLKDGEELLAQPYVVLPVADHRVGILGLTNPGNSDKVTITDPLAAVRQWLPQVQQEADIIILLSHAGLETDQAIAANVPGIDAIVSGGNVTTNEALVVRGTGTVLFHADTARPGYAGEHVGIARLSFSKEGQLTGHTWQRITLDSAYEEDAEINELLKLYASEPEG